MASCHNTFALPVYVHSAASQISAAFLVVATGLYSAPCMSTYRVRAVLSSAVRQAPWFRRACSSCLLESNACQEQSTSNCRFTPLTYCTVSHMTCTCRVSQGSLVGCCMHVISPLLAQVRFYLPSHMVVLPCDLSNVLQSHTTILAGYAQHR
jgi:hypothetical protein